MDALLFPLLNGLALRQVWIDATILLFANYLPYAMVVCAVGYFFITKRPGRDRIIGLILTLGAAASSRGIAEVIRFFYHRIRPEHALRINSLLTETSWSFPSGHAAWFFALATILYYHNKKLGVAYFILSALMGMARVAAGVHYPTDIFGGAIVGTLTGVFVWRIAQRARGTVQAS